MLSGHKIITTCPELQKPHLFYFLSKTQKKIKSWWYNNNFKMYALKNSKGILC